MKIIQLAVIVHEQVKWKRLIKNCVRRKVGLCSAIYIQETGRAGCDGGYMHRLYSTIVVKVL